MALTKHRSTLLLLIVSLFAASQSASLVSENSIGPLGQDQVCAQTCNLLNRQVAFKPGKTYVYTVDLTTQLATAASQSEQPNQHVKISAVADVSVYDQCELVLRLRKVHLSGVQQHRELAAQLERQPVHFAYEDGRVVDVCTSPAEDQWIVDVKKSIISALQMSSSDVSQRETVIETDISGQCETIYEPLSHDDQITIMRKVKQMNKCGQRHQLYMAFFPRSYGLDQALRSSLPFVASNATNECTQVIKNQIVEAVTCKDHQRIRQLGVDVSSRIEIQLIEQKPTLTVEKLSSGFSAHKLSYQEVTIRSERPTRRYSVQEVQQLLRQICARVQTTVQVDVPVFFYELVQSVHSLPVQEQAQLWEQVRSRELCQSTKLVDIFLDASALAGNEGSAEVLIRAYQQQQISQPRANYLFGLLSFAKQPTVEAAQRLVQFVQQQQQQQIVQLPRGVIFGITGFVHNLQIVQTHQSQQNPAVDEVVAQIGQLLIQWVQQLVPQVSGQVQQQQALTLIYALKNLVLMPGTRGSQSQPQFAQQIWHILQQTPVNGHTVEIRVALVQTLVNAGINDQIRQYLLEQVVQNSQEGIEIQIEAYKAVVLSGATKAQLEQIKQYTDQVAGQPQQQDLVNYIRSHQANLRTTSDPHKQTILPVNAPVFDKPTGRWFGISRNYELSYVNPELNLGVTAETDVIYDPVNSQRSFAPVPQTVSFNLTIPIGGQELQLVEVRLHQHGLEPVIARHLAQINTRSSAEPWQVAKETVEYIFAHGADILAQNPQVHFLIQLSVDGKTVVLIDEQDFVTGEVARQTFVQELISKLRYQAVLDRAFAFTPLDTLVAFPSISGLPIQVRLNHTVVVGLRSELDFDIRDLANSVARFAVYPSFVSQYESAVQFHVGPHEVKSVEFVQNVYSAPQVNFGAELKNGRIVNVKVQVPEHQIVLGRVESQLFTRDVHGRRVRVAPARALSYQGQQQYEQNYHVCSNVTQNVLGVVLCYDLSYNSPNPDSFDIVSEVTLVRTDPQLRSYELYFESPYSLPELFSSRKNQYASRDQEPLDFQLAPFKLVFNTPGSAIDREIVLEVELPNSGSDRVKQARLRIQTPWKRVLAQASVRSEPKERVASVEVSVDEQQFVQMELALETVRRGQKIEYRPRLILNSDSLLASPVNLAGVLTYSRGRKSLVHFQLEDVIAKRHFIKGTLIKERGERNAALAARTSADLDISLVGFEAKLAATFELADRLVKLDFATDYQLPSWSRKEQAKIAFKVQNLSSGKMVKLVQFGMVKLSQLPQYQVRYSQNVMYAAGEQFEHDLKLGWAVDDDEQIRLYQLVKKTGQRGKLDIEAQSIVVYRPRAINYEVRATAALVGFGINGQKRYTIMINGAARDQPSSDSNFSAELAYSHLGKSPLKMKMRASIKSRALDIIYSDEIEEREPSKYHGHILLQLAPEERYSADYVYQIKSDGQRLYQQRRAGGFEEHELTAELKDASAQKVWRHRGLLRMESDRTMLLRSKVSRDGEGDIWDGELSLSAAGKKVNGYFSHFPNDLRLKVVQDLTTTPQTSSLELTTPEWRHESSVERVPYQSWAAQTKTKYRDENVLSVSYTGVRQVLGGDKVQLIDFTTVNSQQNYPLRSQRFALSSKHLDGEWQLDLPEDAQQKAHIRVDLPASWSHQSTLTRNPTKPYISLESRTKHRTSNIAELSAKYDPEEEHYFKLNTPLARTDLNAQLNRDRSSIRSAELALEAGKYIHLSKLAVEPRDDSLDFESVTKKSGQPLASLRYQWSPDNVHNIEIDSPKLITATAKCNLARTTPKPFASIDVKLTDQQGRELQHQTKLSGERESRAWNSIGSLSLESNTLKQNQNVAQIEANLSKEQNAKSFAKIRIGDHLESKIELEPYKNAKIKVDCPDYDHLTELTYSPSEEEGKGDWKIQSQTIALKNQRQRYSLEAEHLRRRRSSFNIDVPQFDSRMAYEHPEGDQRNHQMAFEFNGKSTESPLAHRTSMRWLNADASRPVLRLESHTTRRVKRTGEEQNVLRVDAAYHHQEPAVPSSLKVKFGNSLSGDLNVSLWNPREKSVELAGELADKRSGAMYKHESSARFQPHLLRMSFDSTTKRNGQMWARVSSVLSRNPEEKSYLNMNGGIELPWAAQMEVHPRNRRALVDFDVAPYTHRTEFSGENGYQLKTVTTRAQQNVFNLDGSLNPASEQSHLKIQANGPQNEYHSEILVHPAKKFGQISLRTNNLKHESMFKIVDPVASGAPEQPKTAHFKTNTVYQNQLLADINAQIRGAHGENRIEAELPRFSLKSSLDMPAKQGTFDLKHRHSGRHLLGSVAVNQQTDVDRSFHFDFAWDVERNPASKVQIDLSVKRVPSVQRTSFLSKANDDLVVVFAAQYAANQLVLNSQLVPEQVFQNPIRISLAFVPLDAARLADSWELIYSHTMEDQSQFQCKWDFIVAQQVKYGLQLNGQVTETAFRFGAKSIAPRKPQLQITFNLSAGSRVPGQQYYLEATAVHAETNQYQLIFNLTKHLETRKLDGKLEIRLPNMEVHVASFTLDLVHRQFALDVVNEKTGKQVDVQASYADNLVHLNAVSNIAFFPKVDAKIRYVPGEEFHAKLDLDEERKFELTTKYTGELSTLQFYVLTKVDSVYTPSVEFIAQGRKSVEDGNNERLVTLSGKYNMQPVFDGTFRQQNVQQWTAEGSVTSIRTGEKIVDTSVQSIPVDGNSNSYQIKFVPRENQLVQPISAVIEERRPTAANGYIRSIKIEITSQVDARKIASTEVLIKHQRWAHLPEMIEVTLEHVPTASRGTFRVSIHEQIEQQQEQNSLEQSLFDTVPETNGVTGQRVVSKVRDQAVIGWNQKSIGFSLITVEYPASAVEHDVKIYTPSVSGRVFQVRCAHQITRELFFWKQQLRTDATRQREPLYQTTVIAQNDAQNGYIGRVQVESFKFARSPKQVEFHVQPVTEQKPLDIKLRFDVGQSEKSALIVRTVVQHQRSQYQPAGFFGAAGSAAAQNHTLHFSVKTQDRSVLDFEFDGHVSESSVGAVWKNLNRNGRYVQGQYLLRFFGKDRFEAVIAHPTRKHIVAGVYKRVDNRLVMDFLVSKYVAKSLSWTSKTAEQVLVQEHKVHVESRDKCIVADIEDTQSQQRDVITRQVNICADGSRSNLVSISVDSIRNGEKTVEFNARLDSRTVAKTLALSLKWNPEYSRKLLAALLQLSEQNQKQIAEYELVQELVHKYSAVWQKFVQDFAYEPLVKLYEELVPIAEEFGLNRQVIERWVQIAWEPVERVWQETSQYFDQWARAYGEYTAQVKRACDRSPTCSRLVESWELAQRLRDPEEQYRIISESLTTLLQKAHHFVARSHGRLIEKLPTIDWEQLVPEWVNEYIAEAAETVYSWIRQHLTRNPFSPFAGIIDHVETIVAELSQASNVNWERVSGAINQAVRLVFGPQGWSSSYRVLLWDPQNGQLQVEIQAPAPVQPRERTYSWNATATSMARLRKSQQALQSYRELIGKHGINSHDRVSAARYLN